MRRDGGKKSEELVKQKTMGDRGRDAFINLARSRALSCDGQDASGRPSRRGKVDRQRDFAKNGLANLWNMVGSLTNSEIYRTDSYKSGTATTPVCARKLLSRKNIFIREMESVARAKCESERREEKKRRERN